MGLRGDAVGVRGLRQAASLALRGLRVPDGGRHRILSISPSSGPASTAVTITTDGGCTGAYYATIGGTPLTSFVVVDDFTITGVTGSHAVGAVDVAITAASPPDPLLGGYTYTSAGSVAVVSAVSYSTVDTLGGGQRVVVTVDSSTGCTAIKAGGVPFTGFAIDDATHVSGIPGAHAAGVVDVVVTNATGDSTTGTGLIEYWDPTVDADTTLLFDSISNPYNATTGEWAPRYSPLGSFTMGTTLGGTPTTAASGGPSFDGNGSVEGSLTSSPSGPFNANWRDFIGPLVSASRAGTAAAVFSSTSAGLIALGNPYSTGQAFANMAQGTIGIGFGTYSGLPSVMGHTYNSEFGVSVDLSVDGALSGSNYNSVSLASTLGYQVPIVPASAGALHAVVNRFDSTAETYDNFRLSMGSAYSDGSQPASQTFAGDIRSACIQKAKCTDTFITKHYAWARQRFGVP